MFELRPYQNEAVTAVEGQWEQGTKKTLLVLPTGCHAPGEKLLKADGTEILVENVSVGTHLCGSDGTIRNVLEIHEGTDILYKITPVKGCPFIVTGHHPLTLVRTNLKSNPLYPSQKPDLSYMDVSVNEWLTWSKYKKHIYKLTRCRGVKHFENETNTLPVSPYFLGILLGDGGLINSINVTSQDSEVVEYLEIEAKKYEMHLRKEPAGFANTYYFVNNKTISREIRKGLLYQQLHDIGIRRLNSSQKHIPFQYKTSSYKNRLELLAGLIDSDGSLACNGYDFISKSKQLSEDTAFICRSLGLAAYITACEKTCQTGFTGTYYRVSISGNCDIIPCKVKHKKASSRKQKKDVLVTGFSVECLGDGKYYGFTVDGDNRYLLHDFTITHNTGKTVVFSKIIADRVKEGDRALILAHRDELLTQAADKLHKTTGLLCSTEKAEESCLDSFFRVTVGSVQSLMREKRLARFTPDYFGTIVVDEAHHVLSDGYQRVLEYFAVANVLGVTATPDRGDMRNLGTYFDSLAYEYTLPRAIKDGYLTPIKAMTVPLTLDLSGVGVSQGDFKAGELGDALEPYLYQIADEMAKSCADRKTVVFLPLVRTSQKFRDILCSRGFNAAEVNGESPDRKEILADFDAGKYNVLCNSMLLTEGWDCPSVDCIVPLRPTKVRSLYCQMVGRGTRLYPGKTDLLLLDFLWHTERHELCRPAYLIAESDEIAKKMTQKLEEAGCAIDLEEAEKAACDDVVAQREEALAKQLAEMKKRKRALVDPLQFEMSIQAEDLAGYIPSFGWEMAPVSVKQRETLERLGILPDEINNAGKAAKLLDRLSVRRMEGLTTPKQIRFLEGRGFNHVGTWQFSDAKSLIDRIAGNGWRVPYDINPAAYVPGGIAEVSGW